MSLLRFIPELPLLRRELIELSNRRRTYIIRFVGAIVILTFVVYTFLRQVNQIAAGVPGFQFVGGFPLVAAPNSWNPNKFLGTGGLVFNSIVPMLFHFIQVLMPALICGSITLEKERNTLGTLFVTRLSPMTIVIEKLGSRLVPMFTFLLLTFPLLAFVYSLGGVDTTLLMSTLWLLVCECLFYATIGLMCSSWFATTVTAFIWSYVLTGLFVLFSQILRISMLTPFDVWQTAFGGGGYEQGWVRSWLFSLMVETMGSNTARSLVSEVGVIVMCSLPSLLMATVFLILARVFLIRRAFVSSSSILLRLFKRVDVFFTRLNDRTTGGVVLIRDHDSLPLFDPVAWRERAKKSLGKARYLFRILVVLEGPTMFICLGAATVSQSTDFSALRGLLFLMWGIATIILSVKAATMISSERTRETLDALLSTPLTAREILEQKIAGMRRLMIVLSIPILSIHLTLLLMHFELKSVFLRPTLFQTASFLLYCVMTVATTLTVMHLISWMSTLLGLRSSTQSRSVLAAVSVLVGWLVISAGLFSPGAPGYEAFMIMSERVIDTVEPGMESRPKRERMESLASLSACLVRPDGSIQANEAIIIAAANARASRGTAYYALSQSAGMAITASLLVFSMHFILTMLLRTLTLRLASRLLGRQDEMVTMQPMSKISAPARLIPSESVV